MCMLILDSMRGARSQLNSHGKHNELKINVLFVNIIFPSPLNATDRYYFKLSRKRTLPVN